METIEQKYKEALERAKKLQETCDSTAVVGWCEYIFPELKESEDERIKKEFCEDIWTFIPNEKAHKYITWLEKQGTSYTEKDVDDAYLKGVADTKNEIEKQYEAQYQTRKDIATFIFNYRGDLKDRDKWMNYLGIKVSFVEKQSEKPQGKSALEARNEVEADNRNYIKSGDKVEPKFKVGNWYQCIKDFFGKGVTFDKNTAYYCAKEGCLQCEYGCHIAIVKDLYDNFKLWTIEDAKDGDVLVDEDNNIGLYQEKKGDLYWNSCIYLGSDNCLRGFGGYHTIENTHPATQEQRYNFFAKMKEEGYEWDAEEKEWFKICR